MGHAITSHPVHTVAHEVHRLAVDVGTSFQDFRERYERAVPRFDEDRFAALARENATWATVIRATHENAPHGFIIYWSFDSSPLMELAGDRGRCVEYLMGNHVIAQRMFHHDPGVLLYAPLRTAIHTTPEGRIWFTVDQPSTRFASFGDPAIGQVGIDLDRELAGLLAYLDAPVPDALVSGAVTRS